MKVFMRNIAKILKGWITPQYMKLHEEKVLYKTWEIDLSDARANESVDIMGDSILVEALNGSLSIRLNKEDGGLINLAKTREVYSPYWRIYLTNTAQAGKSATLLMGGEAFFEARGIGKTGLVDSDALDINPATTEKQDEMQKVANSLGHDQTTVAAAGTRVQLPDHPCKWAIITAIHTNTNKAYLGGATVSNVSYGLELDARESTDIIYISNTNLIWLDVAVNGEGVSILYGERS